MAAVDEENFPQMPVVRISLVERCLWEPGRSIKFPLPLAIFGRKKQLFSYEFIKARAQVNISSQVFLFHGNHCSVAFFLFCKFLPNFLHIIQCITHRNYSCYLCIHIPLDSTVVLSLSAFLQVPSPPRCHGLQSPIWNHRSSFHLRGFLKMC
jgi:hypothetical protein